MCTCVQTVNETRLVKARKDYRDSCREFIMEGWDHWFWERIKPEEKSLIEKAISENWIIKKGELHESGVFKMDGEIYTFRNKPGLASICHKYELYPEC